MVSLRSAGRPANTDRSLIRQLDLSNRFAETQVDLAYVDSAVDSRSNVLALKSYVDSQNGGYSTITSVNNADANYIPKTLLDAASGVPTLDNGGFVQSTHMPTVRPDRTATWHSISRVYLSGAVQTASTAATAVRLCDIDYADPGFPFIPLIFGNFLMKGEEFQTFGKIYAQLGDGTLWGFGTSTALLEWHSCQCVPFAYTGDNGTRTFSGGGTVTFYASKVSGGGNLSVSSVNGFASLVLVPAL